MSWANLNSKFFQDHQPHRELFDRYLGAFPWNQQVLPIYEWNQLLFIAAVNPAEIHELLPDWPAHWILVQAELGPMETLWQTWDGASEVPHSNPFDSERLIEPAEDATHEGPSFEEPVFEVESAEPDSTQPRITMPELSELTSPPFEIPGLKLDAELPQAKPKIPSLASRTAVPKANEPSEPIDAIDFNPDSFFTSLGADDAPAGVKADSENIFDESAGELPLDESQLPVSDEPLELPEGMAIEPPAVVIASAKAVPPVAPDADDLFSGLHSLSVSKPLAPLPDLSKTDPGIQSKIPAAPKAPIDSGNSKFGPPPPAADRRPGASIAPPPAKTPAPAAAAVEVAASDAGFHGFTISPETLTRLRVLPEGYLTAILAIKAGNSLRIVGWPDEFKKMENAETDFSLGTPSPFRITVRTEKPYHGYLIASPFLDQFFQHWNQGAYPEMMSVVPMMAGQNIIGFIIAFGTSSALTKAGLSGLEKLGLDIVRNWPDSPTAKAS